MKAGLESQIAWEQGRRKTGTLKTNNASNNDHQSSSLKSNCSIQ